MSMIGRIARLARGPTGRRLAQQAVRFAQKPENRQRMRELGSRLTASRSKRR